MKASLMFLVVCWCLRMQAAEHEYYRQFMSSINTNHLPRVMLTPPSLVDTNNTGLKVTNAVLDLKRLLQSGEISGVRLSMAMGEAIGAWGKPTGVYPACLHGLPSLFYKHIALAFDRNELETVRIYPSFTFGDGLSGASTLNHFLRVLGAPKSRRDSGNNCSLIYSVPSASLRLDFHEGRLMSLWLERSPKRAEPWK